MKRLFEIIGLATLMFFSIMITHKTEMVFENVDNIMIEIKEKSEIYKQMEVDAKIDGDTIIPGKYGRSVNIKKSYQQMKKYGAFKEEMLVYNLKKPKISLSDYKDKYIINGYPKDRKISLIFKINNYEGNIDEVLKILDSDNIKATFFVDDEWFSEHNNLINDLINQQHTIGLLSHNLDYQDSSFGWMDTIIKSVTKQKQGYCYYTDKRENLDSCVLLNNYTIKPIEISENLFYEVKKNLNNGVMLSFNLNKQLVHELKTIISYINTKGYSLVSLENLLSEK
ncbi:MAG: polysaccharide deacetylase family protein [Bacilli bacterium]|nr:polysaccharide deacetylase family protein [Bacilli bacterium]